MPRHKRSPGIMSVVALCVAVGLADCSRPAATTPAGPYGLGHTVDAAVIARGDIDVSPDGRGLPTGEGSARAGSVIFSTSCRACHGASILLDAHRWAYATSLFDYVRRAMPPQKKAPLSARDVYAVSAYLLATNGIIDASDVMDAETLPRVAMPGRANFVDAK